jgi:hypothetical protein
VGLPSATSSPCTAICATAQNSREGEGSQQCTQTAHHWCGHQMPQVQPTATVQVFILHRVHFQPISTVLSIYMCW